MRSPGFSLLDALCFEVSFFLPSFLLDILYPPVSGLLGWSEIRTPLKTEEEERGIDARLIADRVSSSRAVMKLY